jgi:hypothetical protein
MPTIEQLKAQSEARQKQLAQLMEVREQRMRDVEAIKASLQAKASQQRAQQQAEEARKKLVEEMKAKAEKDLQALIRSQNAKEKAINPLWPRGVSDSSPVVKVVSSSGAKPLPSQGSPLVPPTPAPVAIVLRPPAPTPAIVGRPAPTPPAPSSNFVVEPSAPAPIVGRPAVAPPAPAVQAVRVPAAPVAPPKPTPPAPAVQVVRVPAAPAKAPAPSAPKTETVQEVEMTAPAVVQASPEQGPVVVDAGVSPDQVSTAVKDSKNGLPLLSWLVAGSLAVVVLSKLRKK